MNTFGSLGLNLSQSLLESPELQKALVENAFGEGPAIYIGPRGRVYASTGDLRDEPHTTVMFVPLGKDTLLDTIREAARFLGLPVDPSSTFFEIRLPAPDGDHTHDHALTELELD